MPRALPLLGCIFLTLVGCSGSSVPLPPAPTSSGKPKDDSSLVFATISKTAYERARIETIRAVRKDVDERITLTGWVMARPGNEVTLTAPTAGYVHFTRNGIFSRKTFVPVPGDAIAAGQELLVLEPVLSPVEQIQVGALKRGIESDLVKADTTLTNAESDYQRIKSLFQDEKNRLRSEQDYEKAKQARDHAREEFKAAQEKLKLFRNDNLTVRSPQRGKVLQLHVSPGQYVAAAVPLISIIDLDPIWIRVPIPEFDLPTVDPKQAVTITWKNPYQEVEGKPSFFHARPTGRVAQVDPFKHTADLWYELEPTKSADRFVKDQMVTVQVKVGKKRSASVLPYSAIAFDAYGHTWIYLERTGAKSAKHEFERRRIELVAAEGDDVIVRPTLTDGEIVVTKGAAQLFSAEFHKTPLNIPGEGD